MKCDARPTMLMAHLQLILRQINDATSNGAKVLLAGIVREQWERSWSLPSSLASRLTIQVQAGILWSCSAYLSCQRRS